MDLFVYLLIYMLLGYLLNLGGFHKSSIYDKHLRSFLSL
jgi:hypothetical protein